MKTQEAYLEFRTLYDWWIGLEADKKDKIAKEVSSILGWSTERVYQSIDRWTEVPEDRRPRLNR